MKKILISLSIIGVVAAIGIGATIAYFNDTETSTGNIFVAGTMDLKVDHLAQTYNGADCKTCSVEVYSSDNTGNTVIERNGAVLTPYPAVLAWTHSNWMTAHAFDPSDEAKWIWEHNPTQSPQDTETDTSYSFQKTFLWMGPVAGATLDLALGSDNMYTVYLNGNQIGQDLSEKNFLSPDHITNIPANYFNQGNNVLKFVVTNKGVTGSTAYTNPAGLIYKFTINGNCEDDYFKNHCQLWSETDLTNETFFDFDDVKPGDWGTNLISLHVDSNDAWACLITNKEPGDEQISEDLNVVIWEEQGAPDGVHQAGEPVLYEGPLVDSKIPIADSTPIGTKIIGGTTKYVGLAWCFGAQTADTGVADITCSGALVDDEAQGDTLSATLTAFAEQWRNNLGFTCSSVVLP